MKKLSILILPVAIVLNSCSMNFKPFSKTKTPPMMATSPNASTVAASTATPEKKGFFSNVGKFFTTSPKDWFRKKEMKAEQVPVTTENPGTYEYFTSQPGYPKTGATWKNKELLSLTNPSNSYILINLSTQRGKLMKGDEVVIDYPICSGRKALPTPTGTFRIMEKIRDKKSGRYGRIYNASGDLVKSDADVYKDKVPEGGKFKGSPMPYWMRLTGDGVGHHIGTVRRYPASHACVRGPSSIIPLVYSRVGVGTKVKIVK